MSPPLFLHIIYCPCFLALYIIFCVLSSTTAEGKPARRSMRLSLNSTCNPLLHNIDAIHTSVERARNLQAERRVFLGRQAADETPISKRIAIMILFSQGFQKASHAVTTTATASVSSTGAPVPVVADKREAFLHCALQKLEQNLLVNTPADVYIWVHRSSLSAIPAWLTPQSFPHVYVMPIEEATWRIPCKLKDDSKWVYRDKFSLGYFLMGRWRLTFSFDFAKAAGYKYHMQFDDDALMKKPIPFNLVDHMDKNNVSMAVVPDLSSEMLDVVKGLPELTRYWLIVNDYEPKGNLFKHMWPHTVHGLHTWGWDKKYRRGYFMTVKTDFWYGEEVQDYLTMILKLGRDIEGRWQEQAVINMIILIFIPENQLWLVKDLYIDHGRNEEAGGSFAQLCSNIKID